jgi:carbamoyl-phosphate synthase large subunit
MNVLLTSAGRRNYLVRYFVEALKGRGTVVVTDRDPTAAVMAESVRAILVPAVHDPGYVARLLGICREQRIGLLLSLNDLELGVLEASRHEFEEEGVQVIVPDREVLHVCMDKLAMARFLKTHGIGTPDTFESVEAAQAALASGDLKCPLIVKPRSGSGSIGLHRVNDEHELEQVCRIVEEEIRLSSLGKFGGDSSGFGAVIQPWIEEKEFNLDVVNDLNGCYQATLCKQKLAMRAGETDKAMTVENPRLSRLGAELGNLLKHPGTLDCDVLSGPSGEFVLDLNPRFGGGYPFAHMAGANVPAALVAWAEGMPVQPEWLSVTPGVVSAKCDRLVALKRNGHGLLH